MTSYLSTLLTTTTSRYTNLRRSLLASEADGDTEDDTHISRVLRAYYIEKGRPFPEWLPPDPRAKPSSPSVQSFVSTNRPGIQSFDTGNAARRSGGVSDLWDPPPAQAPTSQPPTSLRGKRNIGGGAGSTPQTGNAGNFPPQQGTGAMRPPQPPPHAASSGNLSGMSSMAMTQRNAYDGGYLHTAISAPQSGQRTGSYQSQPGSLRSDGSTPPPPGSSGSGGATGGTAQERLKARLWGQGRSASPSAGAGSGGPRGPYERPGGFG